MHQFPEGARVRHLAASRFSRPSGVIENIDTKFRASILPLRRAESSGGLCRAMPPPPPDDLQTGGELQRSYDLVTLKYERLKPTLHADQPP